MSRRSKRACSWRRRSLVFAERRKTGEKGRAPSSKSEVRNFRADELIRVRRCEVCRHSRSARDVCHPIPTSIPGSAVSSGHAALVNIRPWVELERRPCGERCRLSRVRGGAALASSSSHPEGAFEFHRIAEFGPEGKRELAVSIFHQ